MDTWLKTALCWNRIFFIIRRFTSRQIIILKLLSFAVASNHLSKKNCASVNENKNVLYVRDRDKQMNNKQTKKLLWCLSMWPMNECDCSSHAISQTDYGSQSIFCCFFLKSHCAAALLSTEMPNLYEETAFVAAFS